MTAQIFDLSGKTALVLGGTSGIGLALAMGLAEAGADVVASSRRAAQVAETAAKIRALGRSTLECCSDVTDRDSLIGLRQQILDHFGKIDILVNCAGITQRAPSLNFPEEAWTLVWTGVIAPLPRKDFGIGC